MAERICNNCGAPIEEGATECKFCRTPVGSTPDMINRSYSQGSTPGGVQFSDEDSNRAISVLAYMGLLVLVPIFAAANSPFARFHSNQGLVLCITSIVTNIVFIILPSWKFFSFIHTIVNVGIFVLMIIGIVHVLNKEKKELPVIGKITILKQV